MKRQPQSSRLAALLDALPEATTLTLIACTPAFLNLASARIFEEEKSLLLRAGALLIAGSTVGARRGARELFRHPVVRVAAVLAVAIAAATFTALEPRDALFGAYERRHGLLTWLSLIVIFLAAGVTARTAEGRQRLGQAIVLGSLWPCIYGVVQAMGLDPVHWTDVIPGRAGSTLGNPLLMGGYLVIVVPVTVAMASRSSGYWACVAVQLAALIATGSRGPSAALGIGTAAGVLVAYVPTTRRALPWVTGLGAAAAVALVFMLGNVGPAAKRLIDLAPDSVRVRVMIWDGVRQLERTSGWRLFVGYGPENLRHVFPPYYRADLGRIEQTGAMPDRAHNELLDALVTTGIVGALCEFAFFLVVIGAATRLDDRRWRAGLVAATVAHFLEVQVGVATVTSRLLFLAVAAIPVGLQTSDDNLAVVPSPSVSLVHSPELAIAAAIGACSPIVSLMPLWILGNGGSGDVTALRTYLDRLSFATPLLYASVLAAIAIVANALRSRARATSMPRTRAVATAAAVVAAAFVAVVPSRADVLARAGAAFERTGQFAEAVVAYRQAASVDAAGDRYLTPLGRVLMQTAAFGEAQTVLTQVSARDPYSPDPHRNLASVLRMEARTTSSPARREELLSNADREYQEAVRRSPSLPHLWTEWANVDAERRRFDEAEQKLQRAIQLNDSTADAWVLRGLINEVQSRPTLALAAYDEALRRSPAQIAALRGRARVLVVLGRRDEADAAIGALLRVTPGDAVGNALRQGLAGRPTVR